MNKTFATAINCIGGRAQQPAVDWLREHYHVDYVDMVTEPGPDKILSKFEDFKAIDSIRNRVKISITAHQSKVVALVGHHDCAANPGSELMHYEQIRTSVQNIARWNPATQVIGLWVNENWTASVIPVEYSIHLKNVPQAITN